MASSFVTSSPYSHPYAHSRDSSAASSNTSPVTPTFSSQGHTRYPSSSSSLGTSPDSPIKKQALHDLVEEPAEREDEWEYGDDAPMTEEPLCICDSPFCSHRIPTASPPVTASTQGPDYGFADGFLSDGELSSQPSTKRRRSGTGDSSINNLTSRFGRRFPSISRRWRDSQPTTAVSDPVVRSAPPSRTSSVRMSSLTKSLVGHLESRGTLTPPITPAKSQPELSELNGPTRSPPTPVEIQIPIAQDPIDRQVLASTPLLPPMSRTTREHEEAMQSPLQSPTVAESTGNFSLVNTPVSTPIMPTPPLSSKPSKSSLGMARASHMIPSSEIPPMTIAEESDPWAIKLGHANFHILPEPYFPESCDLPSCKRLLEDWESARIEYMRQAARTSEHYGPTSQTMKLTEQKWAGIDAEWKRNHEVAVSRAAASGEGPVYQPLAEIAALSKVPSLNDPQNAGKSPKLDESEIYAPMVQYAKIQRRPSKKANFLRLFTDPASLLGRPGFRR